MYRIMEGTQRTKLFFTQLKSPEKYLVRPTKNHTLMCLPYANNFILSTNCSLSSQHDDTSHKASHPGRQNQRPKQPRENPRNNKNKPLAMHIQLTMVTTPPPMP